MSRDHSGDPEARRLPGAETDPRFASGRYRGFYIQAGCRTVQEMLLQFDSGCVNGWGSDPVGRFEVSGTYDPERGRATWTKRYPGRHSVHYDVTAEIKNGLWGLWQIRGAGGDRGGFQLWPVGGPGAAARGCVEAGLPAEIGEAVGAGV